MYQVSDSVDANGKEYKIFTLKKNNTSYIFNEIRSDISLGCQVVKIHNNKKTAMQPFYAAAYTKDHTQRMNYNSIIPYISMIQSGERTIISFECGLVVINPDKDLEKIENSKNIYGIIENNKIEIKKY